MRRGSRTRSAFRRRRGSARWPLVERNGAIWVWRHAEGKPPSWDVPEIPEFASPDWTEPDVYRWRVRTRNQEMGENGVDRAHFRFVHGTMQVPESVVTVDGAVAPLGQSLADDDAARARRRLHRRQLVSGSAAASRASRASARRCC